ncbi:MAG TPA: transcriptional regulator, partial [Pyrinomonadaceae bacterium]|nr:transcriptional regulator [Pyrinomonadaceae bacterium]
MDKQTKHFYEFGDFRLEPARRKFYQCGRVVALTPKVLDLLVVLIENRGRVLEKRYLLDQVWSDVIVEEHSLTQAISVLRKILGDKPGNYNYIKTIPGRGYQFIAVVTQVMDEDEQVAQITSVSPDKRSWVPAFLTKTLSRRPYFAATFLLIGIFAGILPPWLS